MCWQRGWTLTSNATPTDAGRLTEQLGRALLRLLRGLLLLFLAARHQGRVDPSEDDLLVDEALGDVLAGRQLVHHVQEHFLQDGPQPSGTGPPQQALVGDGLERVLG